MSQETLNREFMKKPIGELVEDVMDESQDVLERGARLTAEVNELRRRAREATDWRKQLERHSGPLLCAAMGISLVMSFVLRKH